MFDPSWEDGCPSCTAGADEMSDGLLDAPARARHHVRLRLPRADREDRAVQGAARAGRSPGTPRTAATSTTTSTSRSTSRSRRSSTTSAPRPSTRQAGTAYYFEGEQPIEQPGHELLPARRRRGVPHLLDVRPRRRDDRRLVLLPRPDRARPPGGVGGAEGPRRLCARRQARLRGAAARGGTQALRRRPEDHAHARLSSGATRRHPRPRRPSRPARLDRCPTTWPRCSPGLVAIDSVNPDLVAGGAGRGRDRRRRRRPGAREAGLEASVLGGHARSAQRARPRHAAAAAAGRCCCAGTSTRSASRAWPRRSTRASTATGCTGAAPTT